MRKLFILGVFLTLGFMLTACGESEADELVVGLECNYAPFNWTVSEESETSVEIDGVNAYCDGYDVMVAQEIADELGYELVVRKIEWDGLIPALTAGEIDVIIAGMSPTAERMETVNFTDPYYRSEQVFVVNSTSVYADATDLSDFSTASVVAQLGTLQDGLIDQIEGVTHATALTDYPALVASVTSGVNDALVAELPVAQSIVASNPDLVIVQLGENGFTVLDSDVSVSVALRQEDTELRDLINEILEDITTEERNDLMTAALNTQP